jgi:predicted phosphohydrolase
MQRYRYISDIHNEIDPYVIPSHEDDRDTILIIAGDFYTAKRTKHLEKLTELFEDVAGRFKHVLMVLGNHDYWFRQFKSAVGEYTNAVGHLDNVTILEKKAITIDDVVFIGATLWADMDGGKETTMYFARHGDGIRGPMNDYKRIRASGYSRPVTPLMTVTDHTLAVKYIEHELQNVREDQKVVVITHHAPLLESLTHDDHSLNGCYASDLSELIKTHSPDIWVHGHIHQTHDYMYENTRVLCSPRGYIPVEPNPEFDPFAHFIL